MSAGRSKVAELKHAEMVDSSNSDAFTISDSGGDDTAYHTNGLAGGDLSGWTFDAGGAGSNFSVDEVVQNSSDIRCRTTAAHGLAVGDIISLSNFSDGAYTDFFVVKAVSDSTHFDVTATFTADGSGTMDQAATLIAGTGAAGDYLVMWSASATAQSNNDIFEFAVHIEAAHQASTNQERKFGIAADIGAMSGVSIITIADGDHISFMIRNTVGSGNITLKDFALVLLRIGG